MGKSSSILLLVGLLALWAQLPSGASQNVTKTEDGCPGPVGKAANCSEECQADSDCAETLKCCPTTCGWSCQTPYEKPGTCPVVRRGFPLLGLCRHQCRVDSHCPSNRKCCRNGCSKMACVSPQ
ncbi:WAP four-disulfide core domain protein 2 [Pelodiscus sinensis]|uniref:WAP four-disulfide core domain protein 2 n=1 Tax=Pelodiscus sinensis TaxID=13735 RepID=UPI003F6B89DC